MITTSLLLSLLIGIGFAAQWLAWRTRLPAILYLLLSGALLGPGLNILNPDEIFGELLFPFVSLAVAVILFEGALTLKFDELKNLGRSVRRLLTVGVAITWVAIALLTKWLIGVDWGLAILFGAIMVVTGPTVIIPMLRTVRPNANISRILRWEGIVIDPIGALLAVLVFEFLVSAGSEHPIGHTVMLFFKVVLIGSGLGVAGGFLLSLFLRRFWIPEYLHTMATLTLVFVVFSISNAVAEESGLLSVTIMGMWLANARGLNLDEILHFKENLSVVLISGLFVILAARMNPADITSIGPQVLLLFLAVQFFVRPLSILIATIKTEINWREKAMLGWLAPRGIVAAAVSALFALKLADADINGAQLLVPLSFTIIVGTVLVQSLSAKWLARALKVNAPAPTGFILIGANPVAQAIGKSLKTLGFDVLLCDSNWGHIKTARMAGLNGFYGNPMSEYAEQKLDLSGFGKVMALSPYREQNAIASLHFRSDLGKNNIFTLLADSDTLPSEKHRISFGHHGLVLFNKYLTYSRFAQLLREGAEIKKTKLTEEFDFDDYISRKAGKSIALFAMTNKQRIEIFTEGHRLKPEPGWTIFGLSYHKGE